MAKHWKTVTTELETCWLDIKVREDFDFNEQHESIIRDFYDLFDTGLYRDEEAFIEKHKLVPLGNGFFGEVYGLPEGLAIKLLVEPDERLQDGYILRLLDDCVMTPNVYAYSNEGGRGFAIVDRVRGFDVSKVVDHRSAMLGFDLNHNIERVKDFLRVCQQKHVAPVDLHQGNVMIDLHGNMTVVDVGCFVHNTSKKDSAFLHENAKWSLLHQAYLMNHIINGAPMINIPCGVPSAYCVMDWQESALNRQLKEFYEQYPDVHLVGVDL